MIQKFLTRIFGSRNQRLVKGYQQLVTKINSLESALTNLSETQLVQKTLNFKERLVQGETLDSLLPEAFAVCREAGRRVLGMRHFDVQLIGGMVLHDGKIAEMRTGEGKTLTATLPVYLNALTGKGVHVVTVNDYLASRDSEWMGRLYRFLGLTVGTVLSQQSNSDKKSSYACDIVYGTNNEFGFDYLRDNMEYSVEDRRQRGLVYAIIDEVDSILVDEARTPLIISGVAEDHAHFYEKINPIPACLTEMLSEPKPDEEEPEGDYWVDRKLHQVYLSETGHEKAENALFEMGLLTKSESLYDATNIGLMHHVLSALRAHTLYFRDQHYVVQEGEVVIVDEFTGRLMPGRRWSDGLHQAVEAKEGLRVRPENQTLASITFQNYFRLYNKLAGMTGTADTEAYEFQHIYCLETVVIPTHRPMIREDRQDQVFRTSEEKIEAILADIKNCYERGQPVLVGTTSIENSEKLSERLTKEGLPHQVLNAKQHAREAEVIAQAGRPKMITIATNMAGRGTDIVLGGNIEGDIEAINVNPDMSPEDKNKLIEPLRESWRACHEQVLSLGGLHIVGTERHESRRIDNQLRGRAGRQGDPGSSRFYLSMEDPLLKIFAGDRLRAIMGKLRLPYGEPIEAGMVSRAIESAQRRVESRNFDVRKQLLEYDDVSNQQRKVVYADRNKLLEAPDFSDRISEMRFQVLWDIFRSCVPEGSEAETWDLLKIQDVLASDWDCSINLKELAGGDGKPLLSEQELFSALLKHTEDYYQARVADLGENLFRGFERTVLLHNIDQAWREHLSNLEYLRQGIHLRGYAQKDPKEEFKREAFEMFVLMQKRICLDVTRTLMSSHLQKEEIEDATYESSAVSFFKQDLPESQNFNVHNVSEKSDQLSDLRSVSVPVHLSNQGFPLHPELVGLSDAPVERNALCPCNSGKKYKHCHGLLG